MILKLFQFKKFKNNWNIYAIAYRDNKRKYLKLIPYAWSLIRLRSKNNNKFRELNSLLNIFKNFNI